MPRWTTPMIVVALVAAACGSSSDDSLEPGASSTPTVLECEAKGYPCSLAEVPIEILERSDSLSDEALDMFEAGASRSDVDTWLDGQEGMAEVESDHQAVRFRLDGGRGTWILRTGAFATRSAPSSFQQPTGPMAADSFHVAGPDTDAKKALVLSPMLWDFGALDDGALVAGILSGTRGYEGGVAFLANETKTASNVTVDSFKGWGDFQVVHVVTHGTRLCENGSCRAVIAAGTLQGVAPEGRGILTRSASGLTDRGLEFAKVEGPRGLEIDPDPDPEPDPDRVVLVLLTAEFFLAEYDGAGLDDTLIFFNACETFASNATDLADAIRGTTSVFLGWNDTVSNDAAFAAAEALYEDLSERGYPVQVAYSKLEGLQTDAFLQGAQLVMGKRRDGDGLRIRDVVELLDPDSEELLTASSEVAIVGTQGDDEPDFVPYAVQVDGMTNEFAPQVTLHVSVDGEEIEPQPVSDGQVNDQDQWLLTGVAPLGFDLEESTTVDFRAWVELHSGGESDDETSATVIGEEPIMGLIWVMEATSVVGLVGTANESTAVLTLEFEKGQELNEPHPRYVVTGGTVTYGDRGGSALGCDYSGGGLTFEVNASSSPPNRSDGFASSVLTFDTTVTPVEYQGVIYTEGPDDTVTQTCDDNDPDTNDTNVVSYGGSTTWMIVESSDHLTVTDRKLVIGSVQPSSGHTLEFTITRTK